MDTEQTTEQLKSIVSGAPEGATHYLINQYDFTEGYFKLTDNCEVLVDGADGWQEVDIDIPINGNHQVSEISAIREIIALRESNAELEIQEQELKALLYCCNGMSEEYAERNHGDSELWLRHIYQAYTKYQTLKEQGK